ncbi:hypothetical protein BTVI_42796 [Pitangus sulphuratus]|nr:hypothetical protein BTVI_42796 [Pitangus sulphuratus]
MTHMPEELPWMATSSSEGTGKVGEVEGWLCILESVLTLELEVSNDKVECLWIKIRGKANKADILVGVCYRPPNQDDEDDELYDRQLADVSKLPVYGTRWDPPKGDEGAGRRACRAALHQLPTVLAHWGGPRRLEKTFKNLDTLVKCIFLLF